MHRVLFIAGCWRSGSTLLGDLLGSVPGFCHVGELHHVWRRGLQLNWLCGCGARFRSCSFWRDVTAEWAAEPATEQVEKLERARIGLRTRSASNATASQFCDVAPGYVEAMQRLVAAVFRASGSRILVDSSKSSRQAMVLLATGALDLNVVHLVRDSRATVFSLVARPKLRLDDPQGSAMLQPDLESAIRLWRQSNQEAERLGRLRQCEYALVRYEELVSAPRATLEQIVSFAGADPSALHSLAGRGNPRRLWPQHTLSGNPDRLCKGARTEVRADDEWQRRMDPAIRDYIEERTRDLLARYGY